MVKLFKVARLCTQFAVSFTAALINTLFNYKTHVQ